MNVEYFYTDDRYELISVEPLKLENKSWMSCPAISSIVKNTFVINSPMYIKLLWQGTDGNGEGIVRLDPSSDLVDESFDSFVGINKAYEWKSKIKPLLQFGPNIVFKSSEHLEMELFPPFLEYKPNYPGLVVPAKFNIGYWLRPIQVATMWEDITKPLVINKGDPLCYIRFDTNRNVKLKKIERTEKLMNEVNRNVGLKNLVKKHTAIAMNYLRGKKNG